MAPSAKAVEETTRGTSGTVEMAWPRARRRAGLPEAASAEAVAKRFWLRLIFWCHLRQTLVGYLSVSLAHGGLHGSTNSKHASTAAHVTESSLSGTVGSATRDTGDTGNSATGTPGLSRGLVTSLLGNSVGLALVLVHASVNRLDNVGPDGRLEVVSYRFCC